MRAAKIVLTSLVLTNLAVASLITTAALAQEAKSGIVTKIDRLTGTIGVQQTQTGTVGAAGSAVQEFKVPKAQSLEDLHAGDKVTYSTSGGGDGKTIDKLTKQ
jgi:Cu/Ag efflux protein CusF